MPACVNVWIFLESKKNQAGTFVTVCLLCMPGLEPVYRKSELCWGLWHTPTHGRMPKGVPAGLWWVHWPPDFIFDFSFYGYSNTQA